MRTTGTGIDDACYHAPVRKLITLALAFLLLFQVAAASGAVLDACCPDCVVQAQCMTAGCSACVAPALPALPIRLALMPTPSPAMEFEAMLPPSFIAQLWKPPG